MELPKLYPITDPYLSGLSHVEQVRRMAAGGAKLIQLREKKASPREFYETARLAVQAAREHGVKLIINDRVDIALAVGADGVHLGQDDLPPESARQILGARAIIGYSTHDLKQALMADLMPVDYIAIGPVFQTSTKENPDPVVGLDLIRQLKSQLSKPLVAIGGLSLERARQVLTAGADSVAVISDLFSTADLVSRIQAFLRL